MPSLSSKRLYLRGLQKNITEEALSKYLSCYGEISEVKMLQNYAFVQFESEKDAQVVLETYQSQPLLGRSVIIEFAHRLRKDMPSMTSSNNSDKISTRGSSTRSHSRHPVVVTNIPRDVRWQELKDFGRLSGRLVAYCDLDQTQRGRGFIEYFTKRDAERAVRILNGRHLFGKRVRVTDHESRGRSSNRRIERLHLRSRSPERASISSRHRRHDYDHDHRYAENSTIHRTYSYSASDECYDQTEPRHPLSTYPSNVEDRREVFQHSLAAADSYTYTGRVTSWKWSGHHDYHHGYDVPDQYMGGVYHDQADSGFGGSEVCRDYNYTSQLDPYQDQV